MQGFNGILCNYQIRLFGQVCQILKGSEASVRIADIFIAADRIAAGFLLLICGFFIEIRLFKQFL